MLRYMLAIDRLFGLPAHPLLVHGAVVLVPLAGTAFLVTGWREAWRRAYYLPITLAAAAGGIFAFLAKESGGPLSESIRDAGKRVGEHPEQGDTAFVFAMIMAVAIFALYVLHRFGREISEALNLRLPKLPVSYGTIAYVAVAPLAVLAIVTMLIAGHSGAELIWKTNA